MKRTWIICLMAVCTLCCSAQITPIEKYEIAPGDYEQVFLDQISKYRSRVIDTAFGQYVGQVDHLNQLYGYGMLINLDGSRIIGKFRENKLLFGITIADRISLVGSPEYHVVYNMAGGDIEYILRGKEKETMEGKDTNDYRFRTISYPNGELYVGETYMGKRHGYGIYYYSNGDFWFGEFGNDQRWGYGAFFTSESGIFAGEWQGELAVRVISIKQR